MDVVRSTPDLSGPVVVVNRVSDRQWHALEDDLVVGRGEASRRPDGRMFLSIDSWHDAVFDRLAEAMRSDLPEPLYTVADEADLDLISGWRRAGFATWRREWEYVLPTDPPSAAPPPEGVRMVPAGTAEESALAELYQAVRTETAWESMPSEVLARPEGSPLLDPSRYAAAAFDGRYVGLLRVVARRRHARIGLIAVRAGSRRRGVARALLAHVLDSLGRSGVDRASAAVDESNRAAVALFEGAGGHRAGGNLELVRGKGR